MEIILDKLCVSLIMIVKEEKYEKKNRFNGTREN